MIRCIIIVWQKTMIVWEEQVMNKENKEIIKQEEASTQLFIDEFESISQKTIPYLILKYFSSIVSLFCSFFAFAVGVYAGSTHLTETLAGLIIVFAVGALFNSDFFKRILLTDRYHQRIVKQYRQYLVDDYLELTKKIEKSSL